jgi:hypothetical protein
MNLSGVGTLGRARGQLRTHRGVAAHDVPVHVIVINSGMFVHVAAIHFFFWSGGKSFGSSFFLFGVCFFIQQTQKNNLKDRATRVGKKRTVDIKKKIKKQKIAGY